MFCAVWFILCATYVILARLNRPNRKSRKHLY